MSWGVYTSAAPRSRYRFAEYKFLGWARGHFDRITDGARNTGLECTCPDKPVLRYVDSPWSGKFKHSPSPWAKAKRWPAPVCLRNAISSSHHCWPLIRKGTPDGPKRRLSIASELITAPKILFLDEPTGYVIFGARLSYFGPLSEVRDMFLERNTPNALASCLVARFLAPIKGCWFPNLHRGLDSKASHNTITYLKSIVQKQVVGWVWGFVDCPSTTECTLQLIVIASIHQSPLRKFDLLDNSLLLSAGMTCYSGPLPHKSSFRT